MITPGNETSESYEIRSTLRSPGLDSGAASSSHMRKPLISTFYYTKEYLKTIFDVNNVENAACDLEGSPKVKFCKNAPIMFKLNIKLNKNHIMTNMQT